MKTFKQDDVAFVIDREGKEAKVNVLGREPDGSYFVIYIDGYGRQTGIPPFRVKHGELLAPKGPYFDVRGQVLTTSPSHLGAVGEIVGTGSSKSGKGYFKVKFDDGSTEWFNEDQVFIDDEVK